ncbi:ABC-2 family transporter protein [Devosia sp. J2-20]|uniref:ABC transporter permease n=1 Tax=Devosia sp. J2-20 TaxID=3026161 RepID=UPI00249C9C4B|nr:ABC-2 family transporter protein [Devosia sp. J2-20]WDQ99179.1 ABC-2 family transporter protein [Devosia sp. J2-20]
MKAVAYVNFTINAFQTRLAYRNAVWAGIFGDLVFIFARIAIWISVYGATSGATVDGFTLPDMVTYALLAGPVLYWDFSRLVNEVGEAVQTGDVTVFLLKPLYYPAYLLAAHFGHFAFKLLLIVLPIGLVVWLTYGLVPPASPFHGLAFLAFWALSFAVLFTLATLAGLLAFWLMTVFALEWFLMSLMTLLSGGLVPLWLFPDWLAAVAGHLPFAWVSYYPAAVYLGKFDAGQTLLYFGIGLSWLLALLAGLGWLWSRARDRLVVQGG